MQASSHSSRENTTGNPIAYEAEDQHQPQFWLLVCRPSAFGIMASSEQSWSASNTNMGVYSDKSCYHNTFSAWSASDRLVYGASCAASDAHVIATAEDNKPLSKIRLKLPSGVGYASIYSLTSSVLEVIDYLGGPYISTYSIFTLSN